jgi:enediyne biosynthesis protein E7
MSTRLGIHLPFGQAPPTPDQPLARYVEAARMSDDAVRFELSGYEFYLVLDPELVRHVLVDEHERFRKNLPSSDALRRLLGDGLLTSEGTLWTTRRRLLRPVFSAGRIGTYIPAIVAATEAMMAHWDRCSQDHSSRELASDMRRIALELTYRVLLRPDLDDPSARINEVHAALDAAFACVSPNPSPPGQCEEALCALDALVDRIVAETGARGELLSAFDGIDANANELCGHSLRDEIKTFLITGSETVANVLTWTLYLLCRHPAHACRVRVEASAALGDQLNVPPYLRGLEFTTAVVKETMRLFPPVWCVGRRAKQLHAIRGSEIPANALLLLSPYVIHRSPAWWAEPDRFDPQRFLNDDMQRRPRLVYFPFGAGPRRCIGETLAIVEIVLIVAMLMQRYRIELVSDAPIHLNASFTLKPDHSVPIRVHH